MPRAAGQSRLAAGQEGRGMDVVVVMGRGILAHFQISGTREQ
ncbi:hypothetical protein NK6_3672 [Bradyrhizobium diazoefficiens]|uniref:Uncharacterized protein n=1 Tax=Bradyrhizobium diazoefficiens TaxID=1355477 RepID=A0A0E4BPE0_9BRAD|nr:hypothetical protein NK6_3672 [Bradyrhizobium diazoefficiens]